MAENDTYQTPLASRYASNEMKTIFSARTRSTTWRKLWIWLAEAEKELGVEISDEAIAQMKANVLMTDNCFKVAAEEEKRRRHDVMAHVYAFGQVAPAAQGIIHLGATSCYCTDNSDLISIRDALDLVRPKLATVIHKLSQFAVEYKDMPTLGYTHYQPAQLITVGRRAAQWVQDLLMDLEDIERARNDLRFRGAQGTTGTQASFMELFNKDRAKVDKLNEIICTKAGFPSCYPISTQTYSRKVDLRVANAISALGTTVQRITGDIRHLAAQKEMEEPLRKIKLGRLPWRINGILCAANWFERTLDDSAIRRITIPEMFLSADAILIAMDNVVSGLVVYPARIRKLPFMATENIMMKMVSLGKSRQDAHEEIRVLSHQASDVVKNQGGKNDLIERMKKSKFLAPVAGDLDQLLDPMNFIGRCPEQVEKFCGPYGEVQQALKPYKHFIHLSKVSELFV
ncbi:adenylosuccinate lyase [Histoplasma capsulatum H143]|uniref:Adenylosuccinate lyase n=1 Tax=Ajellomyces capsulatus (strain H143) TaxID=544712 RepID=C6HSD2_AJECH|nr:adenylosuccinate lyase [Histoplasma capsulatum H143]